MSGYKYLSSLEKFGINLGLERIKLLLEKLDNPHLKFKSIHVAGTNGKGSTCAMMASILKEAGYKVGLYTSPHLFDYTERIQINDKQISRKEFEKGLKLVKQLSNAPLPLGEGGRVQRQRGEGFTLQPTIFEVLTAVAFWYFAKENVDIAVVEVGMGGRLDATNVITPLVSVITNIDYEHTAVLGKTLAKIAREKGGIIKPGVPVVTAETKAEPLRELKKIARNNDALLIRVSGKRLVVSSKLLGSHQRQNEACAIAAIRLAGLSVSRKEIAQGIRKVKWPARFQVVSHKPLIIVDGAHNPAGAKNLRVTIRDRFPGKKFTLIFGCQKDKDAQTMLKILKPITARLIITRSSNPNAAWLKGKEVTASIGQAISAWDRQSPLVIAGSLFVAAEALTRLFARSKITV